VVKLTVLESTGRGAFADRRAFVRARETGVRSTTAGLFDRILVAVCEDAAADAAVRVAADLAATASGEVLVVHVTCHDVPRFGPSAAACGLQADDVSLDRALLRLEAAGVRHRGERWQTVDGRIVQTLVQAADESDASMVVVGSNRKRGVRGWLRRGLALRLAARTSRPVLIVRQGPRSNPTPGSLVPLGRWEPVDGSGARSDSGGRDGRRGSCRPSNSTSADEEALLCRSRIGACDDRWTPDLADRSCAGCEIEHRVLSGG